MDDNAPQTDFIQTVADEKDILRFFFAELHKQFDYPPPPSSSATTTLRLTCRSSSAAP